MQGKLRLRLSSHVALTLMAASVSLASCGSTPPSSFYVLSPFAASGAEGRAEAEFRVGLAPITLPTEVDRSQMVFSVSANERQVSEFTRWASPLADNISRVVEQNLETALGQGTVYRQPARYSPPLDYLLSLEILEFDSNIESECSLLARFHIANRNSEWISSESVAASSPSKTEGPAGVAEAMSTNLATLSAAISKSLRAAHAR